MKPKNILTLTAWVISIAISMTSASAYSKEDCLSHSADQGKYIECLESTIDTLTTKFEQFQIETNKNFQTLETTLISGSLAEETLAASNTEVDNSFKKNPKIPFNLPYKGILIVSATVSSTQVKTKRKPKGAFSKISVNGKDCGASGDYMYVWGGFNSAANAVCVRELEIGGHEIEVEFYSHSSRNLKRYVDYIVIPSHKN